MYRATYLGSPVAVKVLKDNDAVMLGDFRTELNVLQKLHSAHCVQFFGGVTKTAPYMIVTEFMGCGSLADLFESRAALPTRRCVQLALDCARGIAYLHNRQPLAIIHRDLKPANLMIGGGPMDAAAQSGAARARLVAELGVLKIADFGLSKSLKLQLGRGHDEATALEAAAAAAAASAANGGGGGGGAAANGSGGGVNGVNGSGGGGGGLPRPPSLAALLAGKDGSGGSRRGARRDGSVRGSAGGGSAGGSVRGGGSGGGANVLQHTPSYKLTGQTGSYRYMAPEGEGKRTAFLACCRGRERLPRRTPAQTQHVTLPQHSTQRIPTHNKTHQQYKKTVFRHEPYNHKVDQYSFAMIAYQLLEGVPPHWQLGALEAARAAAYEGLRPEWGTRHGHGRRLPERLVRLVEACWAADAAARPEFLEVIAALSEILRELPPEPKGKGGGGGIGGGGGGDGGCTVM